MKTRFLDEKSRWLSILDTALSIPPVVLTLAWCLVVLVVFIPITLALSLFIGVEDAGFWLRDRVKASLGDL